MITVDKSERKDFLPYLNFVKALLMLSVVLYHCMALWMRGGWFNQPPKEESLLLQVGAEWFKTFHTWCFTLIAGYIFCFQKCESKLPTDFRFFFIKKAKRLLLPYAVVSVFWAAPIYKYFYNCSWMDLGKNFILGKRPSQLWFLIMLFLVFLLFYLGYSLFTKNITISIFFFVIMFYVGTVASGMIPNYFQLEMVMRYALFFYLGMCFYLRGVGILNKLPSWSILLIDFITFGIHDRAALYFHKSFVLLELAADVVGAVTAFVIFIRLSRRLLPRMEKSRLCDYVMKNNFYIYLLHQQIIFFVITFLNGKVPPLILALCNFVFSVAGSLGIIWLLQRIRIHRGDDGKEK